MSPNPFDQGRHRVRFDWGPMGLRTHAADVDVVVVIDVLSFTTCVDIALGRGAEVFPYAQHDGSELRYAESHDAVAASRRRDPNVLCLSPTSLSKVEPGTRLVLPSPNGSRLTFSAAELGAQRVIAACIRNGAAVGAQLADDDATVAVIAGGERWKEIPDQMRVAAEDLWGAGCVLSLFEPEDLSPEARIAVAAWRAVELDIRDELFACASGRELVEKDFAEDVALAAQAHVSDLVPTLDDARFVDAGRLS